MEKLRSTPRLLLPGAVHYEMCFYNGLNPQKEPRWSFIYVTYGFLKKNRER